MTADIKVGELTTYSIGDEGNSIVLRLTDQHGQPVSLTFGVHDLGMLAMTLPTLIEAALRKQYGDANFRYTHPMGEWSVEQSSDPAQLIITMKTKDGFGVSFSVLHAKAEHFGNALTDAVSIPATPAFH